MKNKHLFNSLIAPTYIAEDGDSQSVYLPNYSNSPSSGIIKHQQFPEYNQLVYKDFSKGNHNSIKYKHENDKPSRP